MFVARYAIQLPKSLPLSNADGDLGYPDHVSSNQPKRNDMAQLICGGCRTLLMYTRGATSVRCSCCHTINFAQASNQIAHINCGHCRTTLMYPYGAPSVKCAVCQYVTNVGMGNVRVPLPVNRPNGVAATGTTPSTST
ncbi:LSD1 zinc finger family protein isoform 2, partial [Theobroma cacao]